MSFLSFAHFLLSYCYCSCQSQWISYIAGPQITLFHSTSTRCSKNFTLAYIYYYPMDKLVSSYIFSLKVAEATDNVKWGLPVQKKLAHHHIYYKYFAPVYFMYGYFSCANILLAYDKCIHLSLIASRLYHIWRRQKQIYLGGSNLIFFQLVNPYFPTLFIENQPIFSVLT